MKSLVMATLVLSIALAGCAGNAIEYTTPPQDEQGRYVIEVGPNGQNVFGIKYAKVPVGSTVVWTYDGSGEPHNVEAEDGSFKSEISKDAWEFEHTFTEAGEVAYHCLPHLGVGMKGSILVEA